MGEYVDIFRIAVFLVGLIWFIYGVRDLTTASKWAFVFRKEYEEKKDLDLPFCRIVHLGMISAVGHIICGGILMLIAK